MVAFSKQLLTAAVVCGVVQAHPHAKTFQFGSLNPSWVVKRALYNLEKISDQDQKDKLTQGLKDAVTIAAKALEKMDDDKHKDKLDFWFGDKHSYDNGRELVRQVYKNFVGSNTDGTGADVLANVVVDETDYWKPTADNLPNTPADGNTPYCDLEVDGKSGTAYFKRNNNKPGMHFCNKVWDRADLATLLANDCSSLSGQVSTKTWSKNFIGSNVLHEFMHYPRVGREALGSHITDWKYDAWQCRALAANEDEAEREKTLTNADTYVWYALHIAFEELCGRTFSGPRDERDDDETNQDWPDSDPDTADPTNGACDCDENGCSPDSYSCCANGTCE